MTDQERILGANDGCFAHSRNQPPFLLLRHNFRHYPDFLLFFKDDRGRVPQPHVLAITQRLCCGPFHD